MAIPFKYNRRSLLNRRISNGMTAGAIALVVAVFIAAMALVSGVNSTIKNTSSPDNIILLRAGAESEANSIISLDQLNALRFLPFIKQNAAGAPLASPELTQQVFVNASDRTLDNLPIRGVLPVALEAHDSVRIVGGRMFSPSANEVIIGKRIAGRYPGCALGSDLKLGRRTWKVIGIFGAEGNSFESEVWTDLRALQDDSRRGSTFNSIRFKLAPGADFEAMKQQIASDPRVNLHALTESEYYQEQSKSAKNLYTLGMLTSVLMAFAAIFAAMNTMYGAVSARTKEIATLRALGFAPRAVMIAFLVESSMLAMTAAIGGVILALPVNGVSTKFNGAISSPTLAFAFQITPAIIAQAFLFALAIGIAGGWLPARHAMRTTIVEALRKV
jgi:ABC-type lipoprotein release transport system permease subunit